MLHPASASRDVYESRPEVGSSRKRMRGALMSATPMLVRFACPPVDTQVLKVVHEYAALAEVSQT